MALLDLDCLISAVELCLFDFSAKFGELWRLLLDAFSQLGQVGCRVVCEAGFDCVCELCCCQVVALDCLGDFPGCFKLFCLR